MTKKFKQVIEFDSLGRPSGLLHKKQGVDLTKLDGAKSVKVKRVSLIEWDEYSQKWFAHILVGKLKDKNLSVHNFDITMDDVGCTMYDAIDEDGVYLFDEYDDAVKFEIFAFNKIGFD